MTVPYVGVVRYGVCGISRPQGGRWDVEDAVPYGYQSDYRKSSEAGDS